MQLRPRDLGPTWHINVVRQRALGHSRVIIQPRIGALGRLWARGMGLTERVASHTLPMAADKTGPLVGGLGSGLGFAGLLLLFGAASDGLAVTEAAAILSGTAAAVYGSAVLLPRRAFRSLHETPLSAEEMLDFKGRELKKRRELPDVPVMRFVQRFVTNLRGTAARRPGDEIENAYIDLVMDALRQEYLPEEAQVEVRMLLANLGEAVAALPPVERDHVEVADLLAEAEVQAARARRETDPILSASHLRHADALVARAKTAEQIQRRDRQTRALRDEMRSQIGVVRSALPTLTPSPARQDFGATTAHLSTIAAHVQAIAREAVAVAQAEEELDSALMPGRESTVSSTPPTAATAAVAQPEATPQRLQQGRR